jgi:hypothetical protein
VLTEFPDLERDAVRFEDETSVKLATKGEGRFGPRTRDFLHFLNSEPFLGFLQELTGIERALMPDPYLEGAGCHEIKPGGFLKVHADFREHPATGLDRRLNVLVYLNRDWDEEWGGHFELWDEEMQGAVKRIPPNFNTMAIFSTTATSYHGHPDPLRCPPDRSRRSLALYYYTNGRPEEESSDFDPHRTAWQPRTAEEAAELEEWRRKEREELEAELRAKQPARAGRILRDLTPPLVSRGAKRVRAGIRRRRGLEPDESESESAGGG